MRIYIAGPMRGYPRYNFPAFDSAEAALLAAGYPRVCSPARMDRDAGFHPGESIVDEQFMRDAIERDAVAICNSDGIALLPGWEESRGVEVELTIAKFLGLDIRPLADWLPTQ